MAENVTESKRKSRLAVFEHLPSREDNSAKHYSFKTNRYRSPEASASECDLVIDDEDDTVLQGTKKRSRGVRLVEEPLKLTCFWDECGEAFTVYKNYIDHISNHIMNIRGDVQGGSKCFWGDCSCELPSLVALIKHVCYHGYHTKLKNIGENVLERVKLPKCTQMTDFILPNVIDYCCEWDSCDTGFLTIYEFHEHIRLHVNSNPKYTKKGEHIECLWKGCKSKFTSQYKLSDHLRSHTKERVVACPTCGNLFATKTKFYDHRKRQLPIELQSYQCSQCSKLFPSERLLRDHMRSHINHYKCSMCDMTCPKPSILAKHIRFRHLQERPYKCNLCEHACVSKQNLEQHLTTHCSEKLMACDECDFRCRSLYGLDRHYNIKHGQGWTQTYECHCCQASFSRGNRLTKHLIKNHDFHWPSGHSRFRYKEDADGIYRLETVRYESLEVTQEMMRSTCQPPLSSSNVKYDLKKDLSSKTPSYVLMISETGEENVVCSTDNNIVIRIDDVDERGNIVKSETMESNEIVCAPTNVRCLRPRKRKYKS